MRRSSELAFGFYVNRYGCSPDIALEIGGVLFLQSALESTRDPLGHRLDHSVGITCGGPTLFDLEVE